MKLHGVDFLTTLTTKQTERTFREGAADSYGAGAKLAVGLRKMTGVRGEKLEFFTPDDDSDERDAVADLRLGAYIPKWSSSGGGAVVAHL